MKSLCGFAVILLLSTVSATAGDGRLSHQSLGKIGLGGLAVLSDDQGMQIRGLGVYDGSSGYEHGDKGDKNKGDKYGHHHKGQENKCHEGKCQEKCGHEHSNCGQSACHVETLCGHLTSSCRSH
jgi:hypothetical protein